MDIELVNEEEAAELVMEVEAVIKAIENGEIEGEVVHF